MSYRKVWRKKRDRQDRQTDGQTDHGEVIPKCHLCLQQVTQKQSKPDFASAKYGNWRKTASWEKSKVGALRCTEARIRGGHYCSCGIPGQTGHVELTHHVRVRQRPQAGHSRRVVIQANIVTCDKKKQQILLFIVKHSLHNLPLNTTSIMSQGHKILLNQKYNTVADTVVLKVLTRIILNKTLCQTICNDNTVLGNTVDSRYLELGYLELCETRSVYLHQKYILIAFSNHNLALETFLQVQITRSAN